MAHSTAVDTGVIGESWRHRSAAFARDGFVLSGGEPVIPEEIIARAAASNASWIGMLSSSEICRISEPGSFLFNAVYVDAAGRTRGNIPWKLAWMRLTSRKS